MGVTSQTCPSMAAMSSISVSVFILSYLTVCQGAPVGECCVEKSVGETVYSLVKEGNTQQYGCLDNCIYQDKDMPGNMICFRAGDLPVECLGDQGSTGDQGNTDNPMEGGNTDSSPGQGNTDSQGRECQCGLKNKPRIVGGKETEINEFPWMAALKRGGQFFCGGTLVASQWVLSASHCMYLDQDMTIEAKAEDIEIVLGDHDNTVDDETDITKTIKLDSYIKHPNWNVNGDFDADIVMLKLAEEVDLNIFTPACLAKTGQTFVGMKAWAYGWGGLDPAAEQYPNKLMKVEVPIISDEQCQADMGLDGKGCDITITEGMLCAGGVAGEDSCGGDSGGPLTVEVDGQHVLVGDVSFGTREGCAKDGYYGVYAAVSFYRAWVDETMSADSPPTLCQA